MRQIALGHSASIVLALSSSPPQTNGTTLIYQALLREAKLGLRGSTRQPCTPLYAATPQTSHVGQTVAQPDSGETKFDGYLSKHLGNED